MLTRSGRAAARACATAAPIMLALWSGCDDDRSSAGEADDLRSFALSSADLPASSTNAYADRDDAAALGQKLFFDRRMSADGTVSCADCHHADLGFVDDRRLSLGVENLEGGRHALPITSAALMPFLLWDGRADTVWRQPLLALENEREMRFTRTDVALFVASTMPSEYEAVFGALPHLEDVPPGVRPGHPAWDGLSAESKDAVQRVFVNVGKAIEAYERRLTCGDTRFDRWARGEIELSERELEGAAELVRSGCTACHAGPAFSDGLFHNLGLVRGTGAQADRGREAVIAEIVADELNGASVYSDDPVAGAARLAEMGEESGTLGAFRTASLRGVTQRPRFGHLGEHTDLEAFIEDTYRRGGRGGRGRGRDGDGDDDDDDGGDILGERDPLLDDVQVGGDDVEAIVEFLRTLECPPIPAGLLVP